MYLHHEMTKVRQDEITRQLANAHPEAGTDVREIARPRLKVNRRIAQAVATLGVCLAATTAVTVSAHAAARADRGNGSLATITALEHDGFVQTSCLVTGMRMHDYKTGQTVTVR